MHFQKIDTDFLQRSRNTPSLIGISRHHLVLIEFLAVEDRADTENSRARDQTRCDFRAPFIDFAEPRAHVANCRNTIGDEYRQRARRGPAQVNVHVPQAGNEKPAAPIDHLCVRWHCDVSDVSDAAVADDDRRVVHDRAARVDHCDMRNRQAKQQRLHNCPSITGRSSTRANQARNDFARSPGNTSRGARPSISTRQALRTCTSMDCSRSRAVSGSSAMHITSVLRFCDRGSTLYEPTRTILPSMTMLFACSESGPLNSRMSMPARATRWRYFR